MALRPQPPEGGFPRPVWCSAPACSTRTWLGVTTDTGGMFAASLPWKQRSDDAGAAVSAERRPARRRHRRPHPGGSRGDRRRAGSQAAQDTTHFTHRPQPDASPYLQKNAFLLIAPEDLQELLDRTIDAQPFLGQLVADPSLRGLFSALGAGGAGRRARPATCGLDAGAGASSTTALAAARGRPPGAAVVAATARRQAGRAGRQVSGSCWPSRCWITARCSPAAPPPRRCAQAAAALPYVRSGDARVRLTGQVVLDDEEFATVAQGAVAGLVGSFVLVIVWLYLAVRSWRLMVPIVATLVLGLLLTTGFAALAIGTLNLISVAFAVLFVGIAVDFAIQFARALPRPALHATRTSIDALRETGRRSGAQILVAALATAAGFLAFTPTNFVGVAQLGMIAGVGMLIAFACTLTFLPAMLCLCRPRARDRARWASPVAAAGPGRCGAPALVASWACSRCWR